MKSLRSCEYNSKRYNHYSLTHTSQTSPIKKLNFIHCHICYKGLLPIVTHIYLFMFEIEAEAIQQNQGQC